MDPEDGRETAEGVAAIYQAAELTLLSTMAGHLAAGADEDESAWEQQQQRERLAFRREAQSVARQLQATGTPALGDAVRTAGRLGRRRADEDLTDNRVAPSTARPDIDGRRTPTPERTERMAQQAMRDIWAVNNVVAKVSDELYVKVKMNVGARVSANPGGLRVDAVQQALDILTARGITGFKDNAGRNWSLSTYLEMKSRTVVNQELIESHTERMKERGHTLLVVSSHKRPAPQCQPYEGQVLSLDGEEGTVTRNNAAGPGTVQVKIKATLKDARAQGFQHPNCRHAVSAFIPGASKTFTTEPDPEGYAATQRTRELERAIRETKRKQATAVTPEAKKKQAAILRAQQKVIREHVEANGLKRRPRRERIDLGYQIGDVDPKGIPSTPKPKPSAPTKPAAPKPTPKEQAGTLSTSTRELVEQSRATMPSDRAAWLDTTLRYPRDKNGAKLVPEKLQRHLDTTLSVGKAIRDDAMKRIDKDAILKTLQKERAAINALDPNHAVLQKKIAQREQVIIREALAEVRPIGNVKQAVELSDLDIGDATPGTAAGIAAVRRAETIFPDDWLQTASNRGPLRVGAVDRAFYSGDWDFIAAPNKDYVPGYRGAFDSYPDEVMAHELGHRMEQAIPGLTQLEFALVRSRSTKNGVLEDVTRVYPNRPELADEVGYEDEWLNPYAGKTYATDKMADPASRSAEAFQVGIQDTFGRSHKSGEFDKTSQLQEFVIGVMALL